MSIRVELTTVGEVTGEQLARRVPLVSSLRIRNESGRTVSGSVLLGIAGAADATAIAFDLPPDGELSRLGVDVDRGALDGPVLVVTAVAVTDGWIAGSDAGAVVIAQVTPPDDDSAETGGRFHRLRRSFSRRRGRTDAADEHAAPADTEPDTSEQVATALARTVAAVEQRLDAERAERQRAEREAAETEAARLTADAAEREAGEHASREAERDEQDRAAREAAEHAARERFDREAAEQAEQEARAAAARDAALRAESEAADRAEQERVVREEAERVAREAAQREAAERTAREHAEREAVGRAAVEAAERAAAEQAAREREAREATERAEREASELAPQATAPSRRPAEEIPDRPAEPLPGELTFEAWDGGWRGGRIVLDNLNVTANKRLVAAALVEGINGEGPIHIERLARLVCAAFETRKVPATRVAELAVLVPKSTPTSEDGTVLWPARRSPTDWDGFRGGVDTEPRPSEHIPLRELANAMAALLTDRGPMSRTELFAITRRVFGGKRVTPAVEARLTAALDEAATQHRLTVNGDEVAAA